MSQLTGIEMAILANAWITCAGNPELLQAAIDSKKCNNMKVSLKMGGEILQKTIFSRIH